MDILFKTYDKLLEVEHYVHGELKSQDVASSILCGALAGIVAKTAITPAERVKLTFQVTNEKFTLLQAFQRGVDIIRNGGILHLWKGHLATVIRVGPFAGISYAGHDYAEKQFKQYLHKTTLPFHYKFLAGAIGGALATVLTYPLDVLRIRLALVPNMTWTKLIHQGRLYYGIWPTLLGIIPYSGTAWGVKQILILEIYPHYFHRKPHTFEAFVMNAIAGLCGQFVVYPLDIIRRRMQMHGFYNMKETLSSSSFISSASSTTTATTTATAAVMTTTTTTITSTSLLNKSISTSLPSPSSSSSTTVMNSATTTYKPMNIRSSLQYLYKTEGIRGFFKGYSLNIIKGPITLSLSLTTYDVLKHYVDSYE